jgi:hypothetical protein
MLRSVIDEDIEGPTSRVQNYEVVADQVAGSAQVERFSQHATANENVVSLSRKKTTAADGGRPVCVAYDALKGGGTQDSRQLTCWCCGRGRRSERTRRRAKRFYISCVV